MPTWVSDDFTGEFRGYTRGESTESFLFLDIVLPAVDRPVFSILAGQSCRTAKPLQVLEAAFVPNPGHGDRIRVITEPPRVMRHQLGICQAGY